MALSYFTIVAEVQIFAQIRVKFKVSLNFCQLTLSHHVYDYFRYLLLKDFTQNTQSLVGSEYWGPSGSDTTVDGKGREKR